MEITHLRDQNGNMRQIVPGWRLRQILDEEGESTEPPDDFGAHDEWDITERTER